MLRLVLLATLLIVCVPATAEDKKASKKVPLPPPVRRAATLTMNAVPLHYDVTAGPMELTSEDGSVTGRVFYTAYVKKGAALATRPVTFVFNGGPGSASVWLHVGTIGPRRVAMSDHGEPLPPPARLVDNAESWLDLTDLVFIDPIGTGYSRPAKGHKQSEFSGLNEDTRSVAEFIRRYTVKNGRWQSPKFVAGESYGTTRAASLSGYLQDKFGMYLNGVILISAVLNFQTIRFGLGNDLPYALYFPGYAATAHYHKQLDQESQAMALPEFLKKVEHWVLNEYVVALAKGSALKGADRARVAQTMASFTGLTRQFVLRNNLRLSLGRFATELLRDQSRTVGRFDSRLKGINRNDASMRTDYDPSMAAINGPFATAIKHYLRQELRYETDLPYETLSGRVHPWPYPQGRYVNVADTLRSAMTKNRHLRVLIASGYYDLATPYFATDYTVRHLGLAPELADHVTTSYYEAGHMMYIHAPSRVQLKRDVAAFYKNTLNVAQGTAPKSNPKKK